MRHIGGIKQSTYSSTQAGLWSQPPVAPPIHCTWCCSCWFSFTHKKKLQAKKRCESPNKFIGNKNSFLTSWVTSGYKNRLEDGGFPGATDIPLPCLCLSPNRQWRLLTVKLNSGMVTKSRFFPHRTRCLWISLHPDWGENQEFWRGCLATYSKPFTWL